MVFTCEHRYLSRLDSGFTIRKNPSLVNFPAYRSSKTLDTPMKDQFKIKQELIQELDFLRQRIAEFEKIE